MTDLTNIAQKAAEAWYRYGLPKIYNDITETPFYRDILPFLQQAYNLDRPVALVEDELSQEDAEWLNAPMGPPVHSDGPEYPPRNTNDALLSVDDTPPFDTPPPQPRTAEEVAAKAINIVIGRHILMTSRRVQQIVIEHNQKEIIGEIATLITEYGDERVRGKDAEIERLKKKLGEA